MTSRGDFILNQHDHHAKPSSTVTEASDWGAWQPKEYFRDYYGQAVEPDESAAIRFQIETLRRCGQVFSRALEYGCGPTLMRAIAAAPYVRSLDMADWLPSNLERVRSWTVASDDADDWRR